MPEGGKRSVSSRMREAGITEARLTIQWIRPNCVQEKIHRPMGKRIPPTMAP